MSVTSYTIQFIAELLKAKAFLPHPECVIDTLLTDSRKVTRAEESLFFALTGTRNGHQFIANAHENGIRNFIVSNAKYADDYPDSNFILVADVLKALQQLGAFHRKFHHVKVIAITGSNGKTIVKEWLSQLLSGDFDIVRSPKSFNSQIGVPLSLWQINKQHDLGIFEIGISKAGEMLALAELVNPTIGILTNIGEAHAEGFKNRQAKLAEKLLLFKDVELFVYAPEYTSGLTQKDLPGVRKFSWSRTSPADLQISSIRNIGAESELDAVYLNEKIDCTIPFVDGASIENAIICWATLLAMGYTQVDARTKLAHLTKVNMRLQLLNGIENCTLIDDSYSADISSLSIALDFLNLQNQHPKRTLILSDLQETGKAKDVLYGEIATMLKQKKVDRFIAIGPDLSGAANLFAMDATFYGTTQAFIAQLPRIHFGNETILIKGARKFEFERISKMLTQKIHHTVLEIDLSALANNLQYYRSKLNEGVKIMAMVKAFSYGSGSFEIANLLQHHKVDYLTVAYADEGIALRKGGITLPIMVMSPDPFAFEAMLKYKLEPEIYSISILSSLLNFLPEGLEEFPIHIKLDTGMHRLGFKSDDIVELLEILENNNQVRVVSMFTHLVASSEERHDLFSEQQLQQFEILSNQLIATLKYSPLLHVLNTSGITRWKNAQFDMVRLGIGMYGFDSALSNKNGLQAVTSLKTTVTQWKDIKAGESVGYSRQGVLPNGGRIATVKIGYADGYNRKFGNGVGKMLINGNLAPTIGSICMDMCMLDVTGLEVNAGDEVVVFNEQHTIVDLARQIDTIPYEILTSISQRVKRVYFYE